MKEVKIIIGLTKNNQEKIEGDEYLYLIRDVGDMIKTCLFQEGFSIINQTGYWQGQEEKSILISVYTDKISANILNEIEMLKTTYKQDCILLDILDSNVKFI